MADKTEDAEWYIARDGQQHGPLSGVEIQKFIELGHLRATDLVWRAGFADWQLGHEVFPEAAITAPAAAQPATPAEGRGGQIQPGGGAHRLRPDPDQLLNQQSAGTGARQSTSSTQQQIGGSPQFGRPIGQAQAMGQGQPMGGAPQQNIGQMGGPRATNPQSGKRPQMGGSRAAGGSSKGGGKRRRSKRANGDAPARASGRGRRVIWGLAAVVCLAALGGLSWFGFKHLGASYSFGGSSGVVEQQLRAALDKLATNSQAFAKSPFVSKGNTAEEIDSYLQGMPLWRLLKKDYPEWYGTVAKTVRSMRDGQQSEAAISEALAKSIAQLRRKNAKHALSASSHNFVHIAKSFASNLKGLQDAGPKVCYDFISYGEEAPTLIAEMKRPGVSSSVHRQLVSIFLAVKDGRTNAKAYGTAAKEDYERLSTTLKTKYSWKPADLDTFSNPTKLAQAPPNKVCKMVQDWFVAQIGLKDETVRARLLYESLRPLVSG